jgi:ribosomal-protein-alanine N-acetyltransferase
MMHYSFRPMRLGDALAIARWRYEGAYAHYNVNYPTILTVWLVQALFRLLGMNTYYAVCDEQGELVGVFSFYPRGENSLEVGLGMRPDKTGHGAGLDFVLAGLAFARERFNPKYFQLDVAVFNERARTVYERAGFVPTGTMTRRVHGKRYDYIKMSRPA